MGTSQVDLGVHLRMWPKPRRGHNLFSEEDLLVFVTEPESHLNDVVLVRYGELALKSRRVRARFTSRLRDSIIEAFAASDLDCLVEDDGGHLYVLSSDIPAAARRLSQIFGVVSVSPAARVDLEGLGELSALVADYSKNVLRPGMSFAIRARRTGEHDFTSMDLAREAGSAVWNAFEGQLTVDLTSPDQELEVEVRGRRAYIYHRRIPAVGGLPPGSQGRVLCPVRTREDVVAAWLLMRRGCTAVVVVPEGDETAKELAEALGQWDPRLRVRTIPLEEWEWPSLYREMGASRASAVVSGARGPEVPELPLDRGEDPLAFFPLVGLDDPAYAELEAKVLGEG